MKRALLSSAILISLNVAGAQAAQVYLKDGSSLQGTIVSATARDLEVQTVNGVVDVTSDRVLRIDYSDPLTAPDSARSPAPVASSPSLPRARRRAHFEPRVWSQNRRQWLSLGLGLNLPLSSVDFGSVGGGRDDNGDGGFLFSPQYLYGLNSRFSLGANVEFANRSRTESQNLLPASNTEVHGHNVLLLGVAKYALADQGPVRPYLLGGLGAHHSSTQIEAQPNVGFAWSDTNTDEPRSLVDDSHWGFASTLRFGIDFSWTSPTVFGLEIGWTHMSSPSYDPTPSGQALGLAPVTGIQNSLDLVFRWGWRF